MSDYNEGDLVEAVKGTTVLRGRLKRSREDGPDPILVLTPALKSDIVHLASNGYTVTVIERAKPVLPTEPGVYLDKDGEVWGMTDGLPLRYLRNYGADLRTENYAPFTRLEPVPVTAKKVLDALGKYLDGQLTGRTKNDIIGYLAAEFGVTGGLGE